MRRNSIFVFFFYIAGLCIPQYTAAQTYSAPAGEVWRDEGIASWYGDEFDGRPTASGEIFNSALFTAAHPSLPFGTFLKVTNKHNNRWVTVKVNDRGPFVASRIIDVSKAAAEHLDMVNAGTVPVIIETLPGSYALPPKTQAAPPPPPPPAVSQAPAAVPEPPPQSPPPPPQSVYTPPVYQPPPAAAAPEPIAPIEYNYIPYAPMVYSPFYIQPPQPVQNSYPAVPAFPPPPVPPVFEAAPSPQIAPLSESLPQQRQFLAEPLPPQQPFLAEPLPPQKPFLAEPLPQQKPLLAEPLPPQKLPSLETTPPPSGSGFKLIPAINPAPDKKYKLQVGSYKVPRNAVEAFGKLKEAGLNPAYEQNGEFYRVMLTGIRGVEVQSVTDKLEKAGFREAIIREEN